MVMSGCHLQFVGLLPDIEMLRPSKRLTSTQVLSQCPAMPGGTMQPINFSKPQWVGAVFLKCMLRTITMQGLTFTVITTTEKCTLMLD